MAVLCVTVVVVPDDAGGGVCGCVVVFCTIVVVIADDAGVACGGVQALFCVAVCGDSAVVGVACVPLCWSNINIWSRRCCRLRICSSRSSTLISVEIRGGIPKDMSWDDDVGVDSMARVSV